MAWAAIMLKAISAPTDISPFMTAKAPKSRISALVVLETYCTALLPAACRTVASNPVRT